MQATTFSVDQLKWKHPFTCMIAGSTGSGKSQLTFKIIQNRRELIASDADLDVLYCLPPGHSIEIPNFIRKDPKVKFENGIPSFETIQRPTLVVIDDMMSDVNEELMDGFTRFSHHRGISIIFIVQNIFFGGKKGMFRTISLNSSHLIIMKSPRDKRQITTLASQIMPKNSKFIVDVFNECTKNPYTYLLFDLSQTQNEMFRLRTNLFNDDLPQNIIYIDT